MNDLPQPAPENRSVRTARFFTLVQRYRSLLRRRWWVLPIPILLAMGVQMALIWKAPPAFASFGQMIVNVRLQLQTGASYIEELSNFLGTQVALMQSGTVITRAEQRVRSLKPELLPSRVQLQIGVSPKTSIFNLRAVGTDPGYTQAYLDAVMEEYVNLKKEMRSRTSDSTLAGITDELVRLEKELKAGEEELLLFQATNSVVFLQEQGNSAGNYLVQLDRQMASLQTELQLLKMLNLEQNLERQQQRGGASASKESPGGDARDATSLLPADSDYLKVRQQIQLLNAEQQQLAEFLRPKHPKRVALTEEITRKEKLLEIFKQQSVDQLDNRRTSLELQIQNLEREIQDWKVKSLDISTKMARYQKIRANNTRVQNLYEQLLKTMQAVGVDKDINPESVTLLERASAAQPDRPTLTKSLLVAGLIGLALGMGLLLLVDRFDDRMTSFSELHDYFEEEVLGQVPRERVPRKGADLELIQPEDARHAFLEAYRNIRSSLLFMSPSGGLESQVSTLKPSETVGRPKLLLVTSSIPNDGKSMTTANLAITMALTGSRVALLDADLRKGTLHRKFKIEATPGFTEVLQQKTTWAQAIRATHIPNLSLLPCGSTAHDSGELFLKPHTPETLRQIAQQFDYVILDSAPVMAADDVTSLAPCVEGVIFVVRAQHTSARIARAALDLLYQRNVNVLGLVFNAVNPDVGEYYYYSRYKEYYTRPAKG
jgi:capsular exopolysaccharide synthesis family protein